MAVPEVPQQLPVRLERAGSRGCYLGCTFLLAAILLGVSIPILTIARRAGEDSFVVWVVGGGFGLVGVLLLLTGIHQTFALRSKETIFEIDASELARGAEHRICLIQRGPIRLESLRANLVGTRNTGVGKSRKTDYLGTFNLFDSGEAEIGPDAPRTWISRVTIPPDIPPTLDSPLETVTWKFEVWGKVRGRADFMHPFEVTIV